MKNGTHDNSIRHTPSAATSRGAARVRRGSVLIYSAVGLIVMCGFVSLGVDYGRVQVAKTELQSAADLSARYAAGGVKHEIDGVNAAPAMAKAVLLENKVNAKTFKNTQSTIEVGSWNPSSKKFKVESTIDKINAVRVTLTCDASDDTAIALPFASVLGLTEKSLTASSIAVYDIDGATRTGSADEMYLQKYVPATSNIWLAGMPAGTAASMNNPHNSPDYAGDGTTARQSPVAMTNLRLTPGSALNFDGVNGGANNMSSTIRYTGDGNTASIVTNSAGAEQGKSNLKAPINSVVAIFLDDDVPSGTVPPTLDFSTAASRNFQTLKPQLRQIFFIGDGRRDNGDMQQFIVPAGAKRLFIGTMDSYEWNNNVGGFTVTSTAAAKIVIVR